jgi:protein involved in polysaccharide export with SLBB domain
MARTAGPGAHAYGATLLKVLEVTRAPDRRAVAVVGILEGRQEIADRLRRIAAYRGTLALRAAIATGAVAVLALGSALRPVVAAEAPAALPGGRVSLTKNAAGTLVLSGSMPAAATNSSSELDEQKPTLERRVTEPQEMLERVQAPSVDQKRDLSASAAQSLSNDVTRAQQELARMQARLEQMKDYRARGADLTALPFVASDGLVAELKQKLAAEELNAKSLGERYGERHPQVIASAARLADLRSALTKAVDAVATRIEAEQDLASRNLATMKEELGRRQAEATELQRLAEEYAAKDRELRIQQQLVKSMQARMGATLAAQKAAAPFSVSVVGAVNRQGAIEFSASETPIVLEAIARAGGFAGNANRGALRLIRREADGTRSSRTLAEEDVMLGTAPEVQLRAGDVIVVPEKAPVAPATISVTGQVVNPGRFAIPDGGRIPVMDVIAMAGGPSRLADMKRVRITSRRGPHGESGTMVIDLSKLFSPGATGAEPQAEVEVQSGDMIFVPERIL